MEDFAWEIVVYKNHGQFKRAYSKLKSNEVPCACTFRYKLKKNDQLLGLTLFSRDHFNDDTILHESVHMAYGIAKYLQRFGDECRKQLDFEEMIAITTTEIIFGLLKKAKRKIKCNGHT